MREPNDKDLKLTWLDRAEIFFGCSVGLTVYAAISSFFVSTVMLVVINSLPRVSRGGNVTWPWPICLLMGMLIPFIVPWLGVHFFIPKRKWRLYLMVCLLAMFLIEYFLLGSGDTINKAWRRGL